MDGELFSNIFLVISGDEFFGQVNIYLNTVPGEAEGATMFHINADKNDHSDKILVQPEEGAALVFYQVRYSATDICANEENRIF